jgi:hypothetical protein
MFETIETQRLPGTVTYIIRWLLSGPVYLIVVSLIVSTMGLLSFGPLIAVLAAFGAGALGYFVNLKCLHRTAVFVFIPAILLFAEGIYEDATGWSSTRSTSSRMRFVIDNAFGLPGCERRLF